MSNMSYCRFENTLSDLKDCHEQLERLFNGEPCDRIGKANDRERWARIQLLELCETIAKLVEDEREQSGKEAAGVEELVDSLEAHQEELSENHDDEED